MDVLVTGGAGFIGSHLCEYFLRNNHNVACFDNLVTGKLENLDSLLDSTGFEVFNHDVTEYIDLSEVTVFDGDGPDLVFHFASPASPRQYLEYPIKTLKVGSLGTHRTLGVAKKYDSKYMLASTSEVYGDPLEHPQNETYRGNVNPIGLRGVYDEAKRFSESMTMAYHREHNVETKIARIFNTYGPRMSLDDGRVVPNFLRQALEEDPITIYGDGSQTRSFCYVDDLIEGVVKLMDSNLSRPVNLGSTSEITIKELAEMVKKVTNSQSSLTYEPLPEDDPKKRRPDIDRAKSKLGWEPTTELQEGLKKTIPYFTDKLNMKGVEKNSGWSRFEDN